MKIIGVVVLYHPEEDVLKNILSYFPYLDSLVLWHNSPLEESYSSMFESLAPQSKLIHLGDGTNAGIGKALNAAVEYAKEHDFTHILTMDQDSCFEEGAFAEYIRQVASVEDDSVAAFAPVGHTWYKCNTALFITSGTIHPLFIFDKIGLFRDDFFIDAIDVEFSFRVQQHHFRLVTIEGVKMHHRLGKTIVTPFLWGKLITPDYPAFRTYYVIRNHIIVRRLYDRSYHFYPERFKAFLFWRPLNILFVEKDKCNKFKKLLQGIIDGLRMKTGVKN